MSIILGFNDKHTVTIAADRRITDLTGKILSDNSEKIIVVNDHLAFASAGNRAIEELISDELNRVESTENLTTDDILDMIKATFRKVVDAKAVRVYTLPYVFIIAGKGSDDEPHLIDGSNQAGTIEARESEAALFPPADTSQNDCNIIMAMNWKLHKTDYIERTIRDISKKSSLISSTGNKWIYSNQSKTGEMYSF